MKQDHGCTRSRSWFVCVGMGVRVGVVRCRRERSARRLRQVQFHKWVPLLLHLLLERL